MRPKDFSALGYCRFPSDPDLLKWAQAVRPIAAALADDAELQDEWLRCGGTWFAGVNALPNTHNGALGGSGKLVGDAVSFIRDLYPNQRFTWDKAQISVCYPGYPMPMESETTAAFSYRVRRDAAHMDGLHPVGPERRRNWRELHGFVLGVPLTQADRQAAPLVVWEGSHEVLRAALDAVLRDVPLFDWPTTDLTEPYAAARRSVFETCRRVEVSARPGEATLLHRFTLHGVAPWKEGAGSDPEGRMIAYFRPSFEWTAQQALCLP